VKTRSHGHSCFHCIQYLDQTLCSPILSYRHLSRCPNKPLSFVSLIRLSVLSDLKTLMGRPKRGFFWLWLWHSWLPTRRSCFLRKSWKETGRESRRSRRLFWRSQAHNIINIIKALCFFFFSEVSSWFGSDEMTGFLTFDLGWESRRIMFGTYPSAFFLFDLTV